MVFLSSWLSNLDILFDSTACKHPIREKLLGNVAVLSFCLVQISVWGVTHWSFWGVLLYSLTESYDQCLIQTFLLGYLIDLVCIWLLIWFLFYFPLTYTSLHLYPLFVQAWKRNTKPVLHLIVSIMIRNTIQAMLLQSNSKNQSRKRNLTSLNAH